MEARRKKCRIHFAGEEAIMDAAKVLLELLEMESICDRCSLDVEVHY